ncbi:MAG: ATP-binding protein [Ferruginibacter sp.]
MKTRFDSIIRQGYAVAFILIVISYFLFFYSLKQSNDSRKEIIESNNIIKTIEEMSSAARDVETGIRGYFLTGNTRFKEPIIVGDANLIKSSLLLDSAIMEKQGATWELYVDLKEQLQAKRTHDRNMLSLYEATNKQVNDSLIGMLDKSKAQMDDIRIKMRRLRLAEDNVLAGYERKLNTLSNSTNVIAIASFIIVAILGTYSLITFNLENKAKRHSQSEADNSAAQLQKRVEELDRKNKELDRLKRIEKFGATGRMASTMAHEIKNPLNNINLAIEQLAETLDENDENQPLMDIIRRNTGRINVLVTDLLNSTRFLQLNFESSSINTLMDEVLEAAKDRLQLNNVEVVKEYDPAICNVLVDREKIKIAMLNLIINSIEAMEGHPGGHPGKIEVKTESTEGFCNIIIKDNGKGMDSNVMAKLFEPFNTTKAKGTGLGLTNSQNIILNHKGLISVESEISKGSTFIIQLPFDK